MLEISNHGIIPADIISLLQCYLHCSMVGLYRVKMSSMNLLVHVYIFPCSVIFCQSVICPFSGPGMPCVIFIFCTTDVLQNMKSNIGNSWLRILWIDSNNLEWKCSFGGFYDANVLWNLGQTQKLSSPAFMHAMNRMTCVKLLSVVHISVCLSVM